LRRVKKGSQGEKRCQPPNLGKLGKRLLHLAWIWWLARFFPRDQTLLVFTGVAEPMPIGRAAALRLRQLLDGQPGG